MCDIYSQSRQALFFPISISTSKRHHRSINTRVGHDRTREVFLSGSSRWPRALLKERAQRTLHIEQWVLLLCTQACLPSSEPGNVYSVCLKDSDSYEPSMEMAAWSWIVTETHRPAVCLRHSQIWLLTISRLYCWHELRQAHLRGEHWLSPHARLIRCGKRETTLPSDIPLKYGHVHMATEMSYQTVFLLLQHLSSRLSISHNGQLSSIILYSILSNPDLS